MKLLYGHSDEVAALVASMVPGCGRGFGQCQAIGFVDKDESLVGGVVFHNWSPEAGVIEISCASINPRWLTRRIAQTVLRYPFEEIRCQMVVFRVAPENKRTRRLLKALGGQETIIPRLRGRNKDDVIVTLTDDDWRQSRLNEDKDGKAQKPEAA